jgi:hypothetical protein
MTLTAAEYLAKNSPDLVVRAVAAVARAHAEATQEPTEYPAHWFPELKGRVRREPAANPRVFR